MRTLVLSVSILVSSCKSMPSVKEDVSADQSRKTSHFVIRWQPGMATDAEVDAVQARAEASHARFSELLGRDRMPNQLLSIRLKGDAMRGEMPTVSPDSGELILVRFPGVGGGYEAALSHELMHQIRWHLWTNPKLQTDAFLFVEEGLAEALATEAGYPSKGFPTYGFPVSIAAGTWLKSDRALPIPNLIRNHKALNFRCMPQAYTLRLSFMMYLRERFGLAPLIRLGYWPEPLRAEHIEKALGADLESVAGDWKAWAMRQYDSEMDAAQQSTSFLTKTPIRYFEVCASDVG